MDSNAGVPYTLSKLAICCAMTLHFGCHNYMYDRSLAIIQTKSTQNGNYHLVLSVFPFMPKGMLCTQA